jgi:F0F1-type ATP synthase assembly protein I
MMMMLSNIYRQIAYVLLGVEILLLIVALVFFETKTLYSTQIGFVTASLVMVASLLSYQRMVKTRVAHEIITRDDSKDVIDRLEDPYDLYGEEEVQEEVSAEVLKEEKQKLKENRRSIFQTIKDTKAALSVYRLGAYGLLILGFMYLNRHGFLDIPSYLSSLVLPFIVFVGVLLTEKQTATQKSTF